jgi:hypothetical protein
VFRHRGAEVSRLEGFSDAVFAFAVTLLVVSLEVPRTFAELRDAMRGLPAFAVCFALLLHFWWEQHKFFRKYGLQDAPTVALNGAFLFVVLFYVYPLKFLFALVTGGVDAKLTAAELTSLFRIYGLGFAGVHTALAGLYVHAYRKRATLELNASEAVDTRLSIVEQLLLASIGLGSVAVTLVSGARWGLPGWVYFLVGPVRGVMGSYRGARARALAES